ncbi:hypothetical protein [Pedobacter agri]|uniref:hypothetical protein n=1 Tax=Pedobacter agri TaxID=454586 RepID=UPI002930058A|nr:hypothetical protein [Pedobacter agri]
MAKQDQIKHITIERLPYLYQSEYITIARSHIHRGFFVDPTGRKFKYNNPPEWKDDIHIGGNKNPPIPLTPREDCATSYITAADLFRNLKNCKPAFSLSSLLGIHKLDKDLLSALLKSSLGGHESGSTDMGRWTNAIYIYDTESSVYQKIILSENGSRDTFNNHPDTARIISKFGKVGGNAF